MSSASLHLLPETGFPLSIHKHISDQVRSGVAHWVSVGLLYGSWLDDTIKMPERTAQPLSRILRQHSIRRKVLGWALEGDSLVQLGPPPPSYVTSLPICSYVKMGIS